MPRWGNTNQSLLVNDVHNKMNTATIVQKLWNYCNVLRDDGMSYGDYVEQLSYLLFLKTSCQSCCSHRCDDDA